MKKWFFLLLVTCLILYKFVLPKIDAEISDGYYKDWGHPQEEVHKDTPWDKVKKYFKDKFGGKKKEQYIYR